MHIMCHNKNGSLVEFKKKNKKSISAMKRSKEIPRTKFCKTNWTDIRKA